MNLAAMLIPLIPSLVQSVISLIDTIRAHEDTPELAKAQLDAISLQLTTLKEKVAAVRV